MFDDQKKNRMDDVRKIQLYLQPFPNLLTKWGLCSFSFIPKKTRLLKLKLKVRRYLNKNQN